jgi:hypothetical protein
MRKIFLLFLFLIFSFILAAKTALAENNPVPNNKFGIHIIQAEDIPDAANLVNSSDGDWGYVTFVIQKDQRDVPRWQVVFDELRRRHLIPIIRIATRPLDDHWEKPNSDEIDGWVSFFNSLNWVIKDRYIILGNEPNQSKEWGGKIDPVEYADWVKKFVLSLKSSSKDYFVMAAPLDLAAGNTKETMDAYQFWRKIYLKDPDYFKIFDGLASHSYPNPDFSASEYKRGRNSIKSYEWELSILENFGSPKMPVFITETGWVLKSPDEIAKKMKYAFESVWLSDEKVRAVTPFILNYAQPPFEEFSWKDKDGNFQPVYSEIQQIKKIKGEPIQEDKAEIVSYYFTPIIYQNSKYAGVIFIRNTGQTIWQKGEISFKTFSDIGIEIKSEKFEKLEPGEIGLIYAESGRPINESLTDKYVVVRKDQTISKEYNFGVRLVHIPEVKIESIFGRILRLFKGLH